MMTRFSVKNYKCLADVSLPLTPIHVLIGENDSGKTSLLEAMYAFFRSNEIPLQEAFAGAWSGRELVFHASRKPHVEFEGEWPNEQNKSAAPLSLRYGLTVEFPSAKERKCELHDEWIDQGGIRKEIHNHRMSPGVYPKRARASRHELFQEGGFPLGDAQFYRLDPRTMAL